MGFAEYGAADGRPLVYCHGLPASRLEAALTAGAAKRLGLRVIAPDRPGYGLSQERPGRTLADWPLDLEQLADALGIGAFAVLGVSGGGPYAAACAWRLARRLTAVGIVGGLGRLDRRGADREMRLPARLTFWGVRRLPRLMRGVYRGLLGPLIHRFPEAALGLLTVAAPAVDGEILRRPEIRGLLLASIREALRQGTRAVARDLELYAAPWGFEPAAIALPVHLWHGELDATVPVVMGRRLAAAIPGCQARFLPAEGHFSLPIGHMEEILGALAAPPPSKE